MNKTLLSAIAAITLGSVGAQAIDLYQDVNGQVFTSPAEGRTALGQYDTAEAATTKKYSNGITIINQKSPDFLLGKETHINMKFVPEDAPDMWLKAGVRIQGTMESKNTDYNDASKTDKTLNDAYLRRVRFEVAAGFGKHTSFVMDVRNDKSNYGIENDEGSFNVGDAYVNIKKPFDTSLVNFKLYRAKIDVSRTETVKSARVIAYDRPYIADAAAQYISFNRRGANVQMYGDWNKKIHYQIAAGAAANPGKVKDATGSSGSSIELTDQSFFYGGKVKLSPFDGWEETQVTETYMGQGKHFTLGASYWAIPTMKGNIDANEFSLNRSLINAEISGHYKGFMVQAEYFKFDDVIEKNTAPTLNIGASSGWYATSEYVFTDFYYVAPFLRYESWDKFEGEEGYESTSMLAGLNWYLRGNTTKVGMYYQKDTFEQNTGDKDVNIFRVTSQWFF
jgi:hypothetical protein